MLLLQKDVTKELFVTHDRTQNKQPHHNDFVEWLKVIINMTYTNVVVTSLYYLFCLKLLISITITHTRKLEIVIVCLPRFITCLRYFAVVCLFNR